MKDTEVPVCSDAPGDVIEQLGALAFASRLKRLADRLQSDVSRIYREQDLDFHARWFPVGYLLARESPKSVTAIAGSLGVTHVAVNQIAGDMARHGLLVSRRDRADKRRRLLSLSRKGRKTVAELQTLWRTIERCTGEVIALSDHDVLAGISEIEKALDDRGMYDRLAGELKRERLEAIEIVDYKPHLKRSFTAFSERRLNNRFLMKPAGDALLLNPTGQILKKGGRVLLARIGGDIVGTAAVLKCDNGTFQIALMAVTPHALSRLVCEKLTLSVIENARAAGVDNVLVEVRPKSTDLMKLCTELGFVRSGSGSVKQSNRRSKAIKMKLVLRS
jgi:DNA-binding MarR family transcriptional regulator/N-acetylglutamate synthase-like GNAT family acetyltransferase